MHNRRWSATQASVVNRPVARRRPSPFSLLLAWGASGPGGDICGVTSTALDLLAATRADWADGVGRGEWRPPVERSLLRLRPGDELINYAMCAETTSNMQNWLEQCIVLSQVNMWCFHTYLRIDDVVTCDSYRSVRRNNRTYRSGQNLGRWPQVGTISGHGTTWNVTVPLHVMSTYLGNPGTGMGVIVYLDFVSSNLDSNYMYNSTSNRDQKHSYILAWSPDIFSDNQLHSTYLYLGSPELKSSRTLFASFIDLS